MSLFSDIYISVAKNRREKMRVSAINQNYYTKSGLQNSTKRIQPQNEPKLNNAQQISFGDIPGGALGGSTGAAAATIALSILAPAAGPLLILGTYFAGMAAGGYLGDKIEDAL